MCRSTAVTLAKYIERPHRIRTKSIECLLKLGADANLTLEDRDTLLYRIYYYKIAKVLF
jgi:hypothetical protein